jgi:hypothetical protein
LAMPPVGAGAGRKVGSGRSCQSCGKSDRTDWCKMCSTKRGKCQFKEKWATGSAGTEQQPAVAARASKRSTPRDIKQDSPSKNLHKGELTRMRRDPSRTAHGQDRLAALLLSKEATAGESQWPTLPSADVVSDASLCFPFRVIVPTGGGSGKEPPSSPCTLQQP